MVPAASLSVKVTLEAVTDWLNVAVGAVARAAPVALFAGVVEVTAGAGGGAVVVKVQM